ncbi:hypothetical protein I315_03181 [Cryptococcus gattii Ru294]|nr:hypothetical protein I315_03181 [Cryptococcus gattii Ru294]
MPRLPPLPPTPKFATYFPARLLPLSPNPVLIRKAPGRVLLANPSLGDDFVRALGIREGEVIVEGYAGVGGLTRSLVTGGDAVREGKEWEEEKRLESIRPGEKGKGTELPAWMEDLPAMSNYKSRPPAPRIPKLVVSTEGSLGLIQKGLDYNENPHEASLNDFKGRHPDSSIANYIAKETPIVPSPHKDNLLLSHSTVYLWQAVPSVLEHPTVNAALPVYDPSASPGSQKKRPWSAPPPPITIVSQMPNSSLGEQLVSQWVGSAAGEEHKRSWIWEYGRVRIALLCGKSLYDRLMAQPGDKINCKLSIFASAFFHITPLPPYHHVNNIDKHSKQVTESAKAPKPPKVKKSTVPAKGMPDPDILPEDILLPPPGTKTKTYHSDFYPGSYASGESLDRPLLLGVLLTPRLHSPIPAAQKDAWDYVIRRLFVRDTMTLEDSISNLAVGAESLLPAIEAEEGRGVPVSRKRVIRYLDLEEWARVVNVFDNWAFRPENLILDTMIGEDAIRSIGND